MSFEVESGYLKRALIRDDSYPQGVSAPLHVNCECWRKVPITADENRCECGIVYTATGWIVSRPNEEPMDRA